MFEHRLPFVRSPPAVNSWLRTKWKLGPLLFPLPYPILHVPLPNGAQWPWPSLPCVTFLLSRRPTLPTIRLAWPRVSRPLSLTHSNHGLHICISLHPVPGVQTPSPRLLDALQAPETPSSQGQFLTLTLTLFSSPAWVLSSLCSLWRPHLGRAVWPTLPPLPANHLVVGRFIDDPTEPAPCVSPLSLASRPQTMAKVMVTPPTVLQWMTPPQPHEQGSLLLAWESGRLCCARASWHFGAPWSWGWPLLDSQQESRNLSPTATRRWVLPTTMWARKRWNSARPTTSFYPLKPWAKKLFKPCLDMRPPGNAR